MKYLFLLFLTFPNILQAQDSIAVSTSTCETYFKSHEMDENPFFKDGFEKYKEALQAFYETEEYQDYFKKNDGFEGRVHINFVVDSLGNYTRHLSLAAAHPKHSELVVKFLTTIKFVPGIKDGQPVCGEFYLPFVLRHPD